jgi:hypothetical protein
MISYNELRTKKTCFEKAQQQNPIVLRTANAYAVLGATGIYSVTITEDYSVSCTCTAGKHAKFCYHAASALLAQLEEEASATEAEVAHEEYTERIEQNDDAFYVQ